jgi:hypothetical protein
MLRPGFFFRSTAASALLLFILSVFATANVLTWHNDDARTGQNLSEKILTPSNVNSTNFGKLFAINVDGNVHAQPLFVAGLALANGGVHNVVIIATEHDSVYACDADDGTVLWHVSILEAGETTSDDRGCGQVSPEIGITSTPVVDLNTGPHGTIYAVAMSKSGSNYFQRLHALDLATGAEQFGGPVDIVASFPGNGDNSSGGNVIFDPKQYKDRAGLVLADGIIYTTWASHCDIRPYTSWVIGYDQHTLARVRVLNLTPNGNAGAIWAAGAAPAVDSSSNIYALTGNGTFETTLDANGFPNRRDFGNCFVKLSTANDTLALVDYWTMFNTVSESNADTDLGSGGALVLPDMRDANNIIRHLVVGAGKDAHIYLANRDNMGKFNASSNANLYQDVPGALGSNIVLSAPAYFQGRLYYGAVGDHLKAFQFTNARLSSTPASQTAITFGYPGTTPSISANTAANGVVWATQSSETFTAVLHAYDAADLATEFYNSNQAANSRDRFGTGNKFIVPTIANGKVYVGTPSSVAVFGLFNPPRLANISGRAQIGTGDNVLIAGFIIHGSASKQVVLRAIGPSLQVNGTPVPGRLQNPVLELHDKNGALIASNDDWATDVNASQVRAAGLAPSDSREAALARTLVPDFYTAIVRGANNTTGIGLAEMYDLSQPPTSTVANISVRSFAGAGDDVLIGGIIVAGLASQTVLFRALGPDLTARGVANALADPTLELHDINGTLIASNDNWKSTQQAQIEATGLAPGDDRDAAILVRLQPGNYTAIVRGSSRTTGIALVEAYALQ